MENIFDIVNSKLNLKGRIAPAVPGHIAQCLLCEKPYYVLPFFGAVDQICGECNERYKDCAKVICRNCVVTICRVNPRILDNGFYIRPKSVLHIDKCNICKPGLKISTIIEIAAFEKLTRPHKIIVARQR